MEISNEKEKNKAKSSGRIRKPAYQLYARRVAVILAVALFTAISLGKIDSQATSFGWDSKMSTQTRRAAVELNKRLNEQRQKDLTQDSVRLITMTSKLKDEVDDGSREKLTLDTVKKVTEIEKLAHEVKEKMKIAYTHDSF